MVAVSNPALLRTSVCRFHAHSPTHNPASYYLQGAPCSCALSFAGTVSRVHELEARALEPNPFISPMFVLPALRHLTPTANVHALLIYRDAISSTELVGMGLFEFRWASRILPTPHVRAYQTPGNGFLSGLMIDKWCAEDVLAEFFRFTEEQRSWWQHIEFDLRSKSGDFSTLLDRVAGRFGKTWHGRAFERPAIHPQDTRSCDPNSYLSKNRRKKYRRSMKSLQSLGYAEFQILRDAAQLPDAAETFLQMEDQGWKRDTQQSFRSMPSAERFFREMTSNFARENHIFYSELRLDGKTVGSTVNLIAGDEAFAFKSGWASQQEHIGIGALQEIELVRNAPDRLADLQFVDGCTGGNSWLTSLWPERRRVASGVFTGSALADRAARLALQRIRAKLKTELESGSGHRT